MRSKLIRLSLTIAFVFLLISANGFAGDSGKIEITYIANAGVLIQHAGKKVLIDAHHYRGNPYYAPTAANQLEKMVGGFKPFQQVNLLLATHLHADHFDAVTIGRHLFNNRVSKFIGAEQVTGLISANYEAYEQIKEQIKTITPGWKLFSELEVDGIHLKVLGMRHGSRKPTTLENSGFIIKVGKFTILHIGDADGAVENFESCKLPNAGVDFAFVPYWFLTHKPFNKIVNEYIQPGKIFAVHIPPAEEEEISKKIISAYPDATIFTEPMQTVVF